MRVAKHSEREGVGAEGVNRSGGAPKLTGVGMEWVVWLNIPDAGGSLKPHRLKKKKKCDTFE